MDYQEKYKECCPCDYCDNPKHIRQVHLCTEYACYGYSRFEPQPDTPSYVLDKVADVHDSFLW